MLLSCDSGGTLLRWSIADGTALPPLTHRSGSLAGTAVSPCGQTLAMIFGPVDIHDTNKLGVIKLVDLRTWDTKAILPIEPGATRHVAFSPDGQYLAYGLADGNVHLWHASRQNSVIELPIHTER